MTSRTAAPARRGAPSSRATSPKPRRRHRGPTARSARLVAAVVAAALPVASLVSLAVAPAGAQADEAVRLVAMQFDLASDAAVADPGPLSAAPAIAPVRYTAVQIEHRGVARRLRPLGGQATVSLAAGEATAVVAEVDGLRIGSSADGYRDALAGFVASPSLGRLARIDTGGAEAGVVLDVDLGRTLGPDHYLLVQEAGGDAAIRIETLTADGQPTGAVADLGAPYGWNTNHQAEPGVDLWATVLPVPLAAAGPAATGLRIRTSNAELKVVVLEPAVATTAAETTPGAPSSADADPQDERGAEAVVSVVASAVASTATPQPPVAPQVEVTPAPQESDAPPAVADQLTEIPAPEPVPVPAPEPAPAPATDAARATAAATSPATALAMTGLPTEPWILVGLATGLIFFGYTVVAAFRRPTSHGPRPGEVSGHAQLDAFGFD